MGDEKNHIHVFLIKSLKVIDKKEKSQRHSEKNTVLKRNEDNDDRQISCWKQFKLINMPVMGHIENPERKYCQYKIC